MRRRLLPLVRLVALPVEPWLVLEDFIPAGATGNVQSRLIDAQAGAPGFDANPKSGNSD